VKRFSDKWIQNLKSTDKNQEFNAGDGFILRVSKSGSKVFYFRYKTNGKKKFIKLGVYPACTLENAKKKHLELWTVLKNGSDPQELISDISTIEELANYWYKTYISLKRKSPEQVHRTINSDIIPLLGNITLNDITTRKVTIALDKIVARPAPVQANRTFSALKQMFNYAISKGIYIGVNPLHGTKYTDIGGKEEPRERNLSICELKEVLLYLDSNRHRMPKYSVIAIKLLILIGGRVAEVRDAPWSEFDFNNQLWTIPKERYKTGIEHKIHLTPLMMELLSELKKLSGGSNFILPSHKDSKRKNVVYKKGTISLSDKALSRVVKRSQERVGIEQWTLHDLRRTFASRMSDTMNFDFLLIEKMLGHKLPKIMATYQKDEMLEKRKDALEAWSKEISRLMLH